MRTADVSTPAEMRSAAAASKMTTTEMAASGMASADTTTAVRCSATMTSATSRRRISGGGQNGQDNQNDKSLEFCHDSSIGFANELRQQLRRQSKRSNAQCPARVPDRNCLTDVVRPGFIGATGPISRKNHQESW
jgi:crotonobetainyl-CoA:carnitine CoA-transferase CaiB-like acyl-CoA transferase